MKTFHNCLVGVFSACLSTLIYQPSTVLAQGSLTPPGAPAPTMLTLSQMEPRTPISSAHFTITQPGSYYLTTNLAVITGTAITIATSGVGLDLNRFTISSTDSSATGTGILINSDLRNITIVNGFIQGGVTNNGSNVYSGSGFAYGIYYSGTAPVNVLVSGISISGCLDYGIFLDNGNSTVVESSTVATIGSDGIVASTIKNCSAVDCGYTAIDGDQVSDCRGQSTGIGEGIYANAVVQNCLGACIGDGNGIVAYTAQNCFGSSIVSDGIFAETAQNCYGVTSGGTGLYAYCAQNSYGAGSSGLGLQAQYMAVNCFGETDGNDYGLAAENAENCYGFCNSSNYGIFAIYVANGCYGYSYSGTGIYAFIANVCHGATTTGTAISATHNVNSF